MARWEALKPEFVETMPPVKEEGILYISLRYELAIHKCPCGCGHLAVTPFVTGEAKARPEMDEWVLRIDKLDGQPRQVQVTLEPSLQNRFPCRSHYWIRSNRIEWAN